MTNWEYLESLANDAPGELQAWFDSEHVENANGTLDGDTAALDGESDGNPIKEFVGLMQRITELTAERDKLQEQLLIGWECECRLQAERERYREKFGKCLDYADAIHALMDEGMA